MTKETTVAGDFYTGVFKGKNVTIRKCGVGKVACAITITLLKFKYECEKLIFIGTAGSLNKDLKVGDIVISSGCV